MTVTFLDHLSPSDDARLIRDAAERYANSIDDAAIRTSNGFDAGRWSAMAELGWHGILVDASDGGLGLGVAEMAILAEANGLARLPEPFIASSVASATALRHAGGERARALLPLIADGSAIVAPVGFGLPHANPGASLATRKVARGVCITGDVPICAASAETTDFLVWADAGEPLIAHVRPGEPGLVTRSYRTVDGRGVARVTLREHTVADDAIVARGATALRAVARANAYACAALCADVCGTIDRSIALTRTYLNERQQFGRPLAGFQALRHEFADLVVEAQMARSMATLAAYAAENVEACEDLLDRASARVCRAAQAVGQTTIQLHGGMGMTDEMAIGHYFRRLIFLQAMLGQESGALRGRVAALKSEIDDAALMEPSE